MPGGFADSDGGEQTPKVVAPFQFGQIVPFGPTAKAFEDAEGNVILVLHPAVAVAQPLPGQPRSALEVPLPKRFRGGFIPLFEVGDPARDGLIFGHSRFEGQAFATG